MLEAGGGSHKMAVLSLILLIVLPFHFGLGNELNIYRPYEATSDSFVLVSTGVARTQTVCATKCQILVDEADGVRAYQ